MGLIIYVFLFILFMSIRGKTLLVYSLKGVLIAYFIWGTFNFPADIFTLQVVIAINLSLLARRSKPVVEIDKVQSVVITSVAILLIGIMAIKEKQLSISYKNFNVLLASYKRLDEESLIVRLSTLEEDLTNEPGYWAFYCTTLYHFHRDYFLKEKLHCWIKLFPSPGNHLLLGDLHLRNKEFEQAEQSYLMAHFMVPGRQSAKGRLVWLYRESGREQKARLLANEILYERVKVYGFETYKLRQALKEAFGDLINN